LHVEPNYLTRRRLFPLLDRLLALDVAHYVLGHDDAPLPRAAFESLARVLRTAGETVRQYQRNDSAIRDALSGSGTDQDSSRVFEFVKAFQAGLVHEDS
jgi:hypothetical protein